MPSSAARRLHARDRRVAVGGFCVQAAGRGLRPGRNRESRTAPAAARSGRRRPPPCGSGSPCGRDCPAGRGCRAICRAARVTCLIEAPLAGGAFATRTLAQGGAHANAGRLIAGAGRITSSRAASHRARSEYDVVDHRLTCRAIPTCRPARSRPSSPIWRCMPARWRAGPSGRTCRWSGSSTPIRRNTAPCSAASATSGCGSGG